MLNLSGSLSKEEAKQLVSEYLHGLNLNIAALDFDRPWGGFFVIDENQTKKFVDLFFQDYSFEQISKYGSKLSPKILVVEPNKRLSWQYHNRRAEIWTVLYGPVGIISSNDNQQGNIKTLPTSSTIQLNKEERHRLVGLSSWGVVAEIWQHTNPDQASNEDDIIRLEDDFGR